MATKSTIELDKSEFVSLLNRLKFFQTVIQDITSRKPLQELLDQIISSSKKLLNTDAASLLLFNKEEKILYFHTIAGGTASSLKSKPLMIGEGIGGSVAEKKEALIINDCYNDPRFNKSFDSATGFKTKNMICVPMMNNGELIGVIQAINKKGDNNFDREDLQLFEALASQCAVAIENAHLIELEIKAEQNKTEMETAWKIQQRFLPAKIPLVKGCEICIKLKPAKEIGGDYFNILKIDEERTLFFIADVTGKSIPAALIVSTLYSFFEIYFILNKSNFELVKFVEAFNKFLLQSTTADKFATAWFGLYNSSTKKLLSVNAGHNPAYCLRAKEKEIQKLSAGGLMLGSLDFPYSSEEIKFNKGDTIVFYTDGIPEAMNDKEEEFGDEKFEIFLSENKTLSPNDLSKLVFDEIKKFRNGFEQSDDITLGILKFY